MKATLWLILLCLSGPAVAETAELDLGDRDRVVGLFAVPPDTAMEQTVRTYLEQSLARDHADGVSLSLRQAKGHLWARLDGAGAEGYAQSLDRFLAAGDKGLAATRSLQDQRRWKQDWRFFLPLGLALTHNPTVELLHFPPDYSLFDQDYLKSATTRRWSGLLQANGIAPDQADGYQAIIDIAPIAAPASAGAQIEKAQLYDAYADYTVALLTTWAVADGRGKPMLAFGAPVRDWLEHSFGVRLKLGEIGQITLPHGAGTIPVLAADHPSAIYHAARFEDHAENFKGGMIAMTDDLTAACWQAQMGQDPRQPAQAVLDHCRTRWLTARAEVCTLLERTVYNKKPQQADGICAEKVR